MDGADPHTAYMQERRRRLAAERTLERIQGELRRTHEALVSNADRLSRRYLSERERNLTLSDRQAEALRQRREAAEHADRSRRRLWHALEAMRDGFAVFDAAGRLVAANSTYLSLFEADGSIGPGDAACDLFALAGEEGAFDIADATPEAWAEAHVARWAAEEIAPVVLHHYDGRTIRLQDRRAPDGDVVSLAVDVSDEAAREAALSQARDEAEAMGRAKAGFLARMSHEIRTPMNGVMGLADLLLEREGDEEGRLYARTIRDSAEALLHIVNDTLDVSKLESGTVELREDWFDLEAMLADCQRLMQPVARAGVALGLSFPLDGPARVCGDAGRIRQVVMNLLGNALRFTEAGEVVVRVGQAATGDGYAELRITVADTGPGIPKSEQAGIFEAFAQAGSATPERAAEGTGLGLTISKGLAERMGGDLTVLSEPGEGAAFTLTLRCPVEPSAAPVLPARVHVAPAGLAARMVAERLAAAGADIAEMPADGVPSIRVGEAGPGAQVPATPPNDVLIAALRDVSPPPASVPPEPEVPPLLLMADDNATNRLLLDRMMRDGPFRLRIVEDGQAAVEAFEEERPAAVVLDISMPRMDGFEAAAAMRAADPDPPPILALTAHVGEEMTARLAEAGFTAHLNKPLKKQVLLDALATALDAPPSGPRVPAPQSSVTS